jgi:nucleoside-diphosphate-sugar epimerase
VRVFLAGAAGVIGRRLVPQLLRAGHDVTGTTRKPARAAALAAAGVVPAVVDVFDAGALEDAVRKARPEAVIHQLTDLPSGADGRLLPDALERNARVRTAGTRNLVAAARGAGARRLVAQSLAFVYAPGAIPHREDDPLDTDADSRWRTTVEGVVALESAVAGATGVEGIVLRYGFFWGPGTGAASPPADPSVHVDAAARAALLALERGSGIYNVVDDGTAVSNARVRRDLGWDPGFRLDVPAGTPV